MRVLLVVHGFPPNAMGGTEVYAAAQVRTLGELGDDARVFAREFAQDRPEYEIRDHVEHGVPVRFVNRTFRDATCFADSYRSDRVAARASELLDEWRPDVAHVHHLTCLSTTIVSELRRRDIPVVFTLHDYWMLCHRGQLLDRTLTRCEDPRTCRACLGPQVDLGRASTMAARALHTVERVVPPGGVRAIRETASAVVSAFARGDGREEADIRDAHMHETLAQASQILVPSRHMRDRFVAAGVNPSRITISEYGIDPARFQPPLARTAGPLRLGFLGSLMVSKAPHLLVDAWRQLPSGAATVILAGEFAGYHGDSSYRSILDERLAVPGVQLKGPLPHDDVPAYLRTLDVLVVPSIWEENSPLVIREAFAAGVPVVASRIGGIPETITNDVNGLLFEPGNADDLARVLRRFATEPGLRERLRAGIPRVRTLDEATRETREIYERLVRSSTSSARTDPIVNRQSSIISPRATSPRVAAVVLNYETPDETLLAVRSLLASREALSQIIVVDNGKDAECEQRLAPLGGAITFIRSGTNLGFSGGMNLGMRRALDSGATHVFLVNSDAIVPPTTLGVLLAALDADPARGIVSPVIVSRSWPDRVTSRGMAYSESTGRMRHRGVGERFDAATIPEWESVAAVSGCAMLISRDVLDRIGLLDEAYFFSFEDLAFCLAARDAGFDVGVAGRTAVLHEGSRTLGATSVRRLYFATRNHLRAAAQRPATTVATRMARSAAVIGYNLAYAIKARGGTLPSRVEAVLRGMRDHLRGRYGPDVSG